MNELRDDSGDSITRVDNEARSSHNALPDLPFPWASVLNIVTRLWLLPEGKWHLHTAIYLHLALAEKSSIYIQVYTYW